LLEVVQLRVKTATFLGLCFNCIMISYRIMLLTLSLLPFANFFIPLNIVTHCYFYLSVKFARFKYVFIIILFNMYLIMLDKRVLVQKVAKLVIFD